MHKTREAFPAGLYGMLLVAVFGLTLPSLFSPLERWLVGAGALVPRALGALSGTPVAAASPAALERLAALRADLADRVRRHDVQGARPLLSEGADPVLCAVVSTERRGGGGQPSALRLDRSYAEVEGCLPFVTKGGALLGYLLRPGIGLAAEDQPQDHALVVLLNDRTSRRVAAVHELPGGGVLRMLIGPAARVDPAPLRADLWDDPYRASSQSRSGLPVYTLDLPGQADEPPGELLLGRTRIWGYVTGEGAVPLTIGVYVEPPVDPQSLSHVVLWRAPDAEAVVGDSPQPSAHAVTVWDLPGCEGRHLLAADIDIPEGAAVVQDGLCLGTTHGLAFGLGLVTSFPASRQRWSLILLPEEDGERPRELRGEVVEGRPGRALVRFVADRFGSAVLPKGYLFTGSNGPHCPAGLLLGTAKPSPEASDLLEVVVPVHRGPRSATVMVQEGGT